MNSPIEEYLTAEKAAAILDVTPQMIRKLCRAGQLPFYKVGRCIRIARPDFEGYLAGQRVRGQLAHADQDWGKHGHGSGSSKPAVAEGGDGC